MRMDNRGVLPALLIPAILLIFGASAVMLSWLFFAEMVMATLIMLFGFVLLYLGYLAMQANQQKMFAGLIVTAMICMGISVYVSPIELAQVQPVDFNTETNWKNKDWHGVHFKVIFNKEFLDSYEYKSSWKPDGSGETLVAQVCWSKDALSTTNVDLNHYKWWFTEGGDWGQVTETEKQPGAKIIIGDIEQTCSKIFYYIPQGVMEGYFKIEFHAQMYDLLECPAWCWKKIVVDNSYMRSSRGWIDGFEKNPVQIDDEVKVKVSVGYATSKKESEEGKPTGEGGWSLELYSVTQGRTVMTVGSDRIPEGKTTMVSTGYFITNADFDSNPATCMGKNRIEVTLFNNLWQKDQLDEGVVDASEKIPNKPTITISQERPYIGEEITIKIKATPSPLTNLSIIAYNVYARYEAGSGQIFHDVVNGTKYERKASFPDSGWVVITAMCQDAGCRWSEPVEKKILVLEKDQNRFVMSIPWFFLLLLLIWVMISIFLFLIDIPQLEQMHKLIIIVIGFVVIIGLFLGGIIPGVLMIKRKRKRRNR